MKRYNPCIIKRTFLIAVLVFVSGIIQAEDNDLAKLFSDRHTSGTIIISSLDGKTNYIHNSARSKKRFLPASTFKIPNTLIALEEVAVKDEKDIIKWDGKDKGRPEWNKDQCVESAFQISCVWFYQELAKRVGNDKYLRNLEKINYGNKKTGNDITTFWLDGSLQITAEEQIDFLKKVYKEEFSFSKKNYNVLKKVMIVDKTPDYTLRAKTGWGAKDKPGIGWFVGYVESKNQVWFFALNIDITKEEDLKLRKEICIEALKQKGIM